MPPSTRAALVRGRRHRTCAIAAAEPAGGFLGSWFEGGGTPPAVGACGAVRSGRYSPRPARGPIRHPPRNRGSQLHARAGHAGPLRPRGRESSGGGSVDQRRPGRSQTFRSGGSRSSSPGMPTRVSARNGEHRSGRPPCERPDRAISNGLAPSSGRLADSTRLWRRAIFRGSRVSIAS
jgi:hypothetical protein